VGCGGGGVRCQRESREIIRGGGDPQLWETGTKFTKKGDRTKGFTSPKKKTSRDGLVRPYGVEHSMFGKTKGRWRGTREKKGRNAKS